MIDRHKNDYIGVVINGDLVTKFYFDKEADEEKRKIAMAIFKLKGTLQTIAEALAQQLHDELHIICRTELVKEIFVDVSRIYYTSKRSRLPKDNDINMDFFTDYLVQKEVRSSCQTVYHGFYCGTTLGRFNRKDRKFYSVTNSMIDKCHIM